MDSSEKDTTEILFIGKTGGKDETEAKENDDETNEEQEKRTENDNNDEDDKKNNTQLTRNEK